MPVGGDNQGANGKMWFPCPMPPVTQSHRVLLRYLWWGTPWRTLASLPVFYTVTSSPCASTEGATAGAGDWRIVRGTSAGRPPGSDSEIHVRLEQDTELALVELFCLFYAGEDGLKLLTLPPPTSNAAITGMCCHAQFTQCWGWKLGLCTC